MRLSWAGVGDWMRRGGLPWPAAKVGLEGGAGEAKDLVPGSRLLGLPDSTPGVSLSPRTVGVPVSLSLFLFVSDFLGLCISLSLLCLFGFSS